MRLWVWSVLFSASQRKGLGQTIKPVSRGNDLELQASFTDLDKRKTDIVSDQTTTQNITMVVIKCPSLCWYTQPGLCLGDKKTLWLKSETDSYSVVVVVTKHNSWHVISSTTWWFMSRLHSRVDGSYEDQNWRWHVMYLSMTKINFAIQLYFTIYNAQTPVLPEYKYANDTHFVPPSVNMTSWWVNPQHHVFIIGMYYCHSPHMAVKQST